MKEAVHKQGVILVTAGMSGGGTERVIAVLANFLSKRNYAVTILMTSREEVVYELEKAVQVYSLGGSTGGNPLKRLKRIFKLRKCFKQEKDRVIVSFGTETNLFSLLAHMGLKNQIIVSERNDPNQCSYKALRNMVYRMADGLIFQTEEARRCFAQKTAEKGSVIPNPLSENMGRTFYGTRSRDIAAVGRLEPQKNHSLLLRAFQRFNKSHPGYRLVLYGKGALQEELYQLAVNLQIEDKVFFAGFVPDVKEKLQQAAMYVLSSDYEGISNSLMEAMALGLPVISTDCPIGGSGMLIKDKENGLLVPVGDEEALAKAMEYVALDSERAEKMGQAAEYVKEEYSVNRICEKWLKEIVGKEA